MSSEDGRYLISIARRSIESGLEGRYKPLLPVNIPDSLRIRSGAFVSLHAGKKLRGCIGRLAASEQLCMLVADMAYSAAFEDSRFNPLSGKEYEEISIEISVVSPMRKISDIGEIEIGKHGICLRQGGRSGVLLPQVAVERGWSVIEFLEHTADRKAGIGKEGWKDAEILIFEAYIIRESDFDEQ
ncbi:MAG: AmmeMemoRadiSam system protein A [Bacteroidetes bacterium]|nr:AmmeMemoRadiSam system protein A [Bacteroidota bacterium]